MAAGVILFGTLSGIAGAGAASAASGTRLCVDDTPTGCATPDGIGQLIVVSDIAPDSTVWTYPNSSGAIGTIQEAGVNFCMQLNAAGLDSVRGALCVNDQAEQWVNIYDAATKRTEFESIWALDNEGESLCLTVDESELFATTCGAPLGSGNDIDQQWGTS